MGMETDRVRTPTVKGVRPALVVAVVASAMAGLVHGAAARGHDGDRLLVWMFVLCAAAQVLWAAVAVFRPNRTVLLAGLVINGGALLVWSLTRTTGIPFIDALATVESAGTQDVAAALFAGASVAGAARMLARPVARAIIAPGWAGALAAVALLATMPALRAEHVHDRGHDTHLEAGAHGHGDDSAAAHGHDGDAPHDESAADGDEHGHGEGAAGEDDHAHGDGPTGELAGHHGTTGDSAPHPHVPTTGGGGGHGHPSAPGTPHSPSEPSHPHPPADPGDPTPTGPIISLDDPRVTTLQRQIATEMIAEVEAALAGKTVESIKAAGYSWIGDGGGGGYQHYVNWTYYVDGIELDPSRIESIVVQNGQLVSGMYILNPGKTMADVPALAGELTTWHDHQNLCFDLTRNPPMLVGLAVDGVCAHGTLTPTPPMLHVWLVPHPCGPFAGIETHGGTCGHEH